MAMLLHLLALLYLIIKVCSQSTVSDQNACSMGALNNDDVMKGLAGLEDLITQQCSRKETDTSEKVTEELNKINYNLEILKQSNPTTPTLIPIERNNNTRYPYDCQEISDQGQGNDGIYTIQPKGSESFQVYCDMEFDNEMGGFIGWNVIQKRYMGAVDFNRSWDEYKEGFGDLNGEFWLGNEKIRSISLTDEYVFYFEIRKRDIIRHGSSSYFGLASENDDYIMILGKHVSGSSDWFYRYTKGLRFSTYDRDYTGDSWNCGKTGGWWYRPLNARCNYYGNLNGLFGCENGDCMTMAGVYATSSIMKIRRMHN